MFRRVVPAVLAAYNVEYTVIGEPQKGYRNESYAVKLMTGETINLMFFKREPQILERIARADAVSRYAADAGLPVRQRYDQRLLQVAHGTYAGLYTYLPGWTIAWEMYSMKHIKLLGWAMGDLHRVLSQMPTPDGYTVYDELNSLVTRMRRYFADSDVRRATLDKLGYVFDPELLGEFTDVLTTLAGQPGQQMLHMDMVRGNVLFASANSHDVWQIGGTALTGVIDFEKAAYGHPVCDVARTLAFLLVDCPKPADKVTKYFLESGYIKRAKTSLDHRELLEQLVMLFLIYDLYKFLRHTPYESLADNHHYVRTRDLLQEYGMISLKN